ncbi:von Willebrand factor-like isoform X2 [Rana temporaria]|uniref:von Willebrand factor-like isoform X2 n=1 Tax=Rana temporaria TaxID=8407 RepID=UPI001AACB456|nr:von Willebrand factor-like isoform X2 [Rana temporaria]
MGPSSGFLLLLIGITFISTHAIPVLDGDAECPPDQVYNECGSACYSPCGGRDPDVECTQQCVPGCFCKPGFMFLEGSNETKCVPCNPTPTGTECPPDQVYNECGSACYSPCTKRDPDLMCTQQCITGCFCKPGFTFLEGSNETKCVPCNPTPTVPDAECPPDQEYDECRSACYSPCGEMELDQICTDECVAGCFCKPGFTFLEGSNKTKCVPCNPVITVPQECPPDQVYNECGSACYSPCGIMSPDLMCTQQCVPGCFCKPGFTFPEWGDKTQCVPCKFTLRG